ncbi:hypothetical protein VNO77_32894 [Canavalia gladiata]|uniref:Uncharacterized protein n=1 Tax=Canavalia gladiata TaxID=3824 RepID=A0AAN9PYD7_CANGL
MYNLNHTIVHDAIMVPINDAGFASDSKNRIQGRNSSVQVMVQFRILFMLKEVIIHSKLWFDGFKTSYLVRDNE